MPRPALILVAALVVALAIGFAVRSSDVPELAVPEQSVADSRSKAATPAARAGWAQHVQREKRSEGRPSGANEEARPETFETSRGREVDGRPASVRPHDQARAGAPSAGGRNSTGSITTDVTLPSSSTVPGKRAAAAAQPRETGDPAAPQEVAAAPATPAAENHDESLLLSLPLDKSTQPLKGDVPLVEQGVEFSEDGAQFSTSSQLALPNPGISGEAGTISFWLRPDELGPEGVDSALAQFRTLNQYENRLQIGMNAQHLGFMFVDDSGHESPTGTSVNWEPGRWYQVTATWGDNVARLFLDGEEVSAKDYDGVLQAKPDTPLYIGSDYPVATPQPGTRGTLRDFQVYRRAQSLEEIAERAARPPG